MNVVFGLSFLDELNEVYATDLDEVNADVSAQDTACKIGLHLSNVWNQRYFTYASSLAIHAREERTACYELKAVNKKI